jgi:hypothetical protein
LLQAILATETTTDTDYFKLLDLNLRRAEELAYSYKKRLDQVERSQESSEVMIKEFGSVPQMIAKAHSLAEENEILKKEESDFVIDNFLRRHKIALAPVSSLRDFAGVLRSFFESQTALLEQFADPPVITSEAALDFEAFCQDGQFGLAPEEIDTAEFGTAVDSDDLAKFEAMTTTAEKIQMLRRVIEITEALNAKLAGDIPPINPRLIIPGTTRAEKMIEDNQRLMLRIQDAQVRLETGLGENEVLTKQVVARMREREGYFQRYISSLKDMKTLTDSHMVVQACQAQNRAITHELFHLTTVMGLDVFRQEKDGEQSHYLRESFRAASDEFRDLHPVVIEKVELPPEPAEEEPQVLDPFALLKSRKKRIKKGKKSRHAVETPVVTDREHSSAIRSAHGEAVDFGVHPLTPPELLARLSLCVKLGGFLVDEHRDFYGVLTGELKTVCGTLGNQIRELTHTQQTDMQSQLSSINYCSHPILVKQKCQLAIQTDPIRKVDIEIQTGKPPTPPEGAARPKKK